MASNQDMLVVLQDQEQIAQEITNFYSNYKKSSLENRNKLDYVNKQVNKVCGLFKRLSDNDAFLLSMEDKTHQYFTENFFKNFSKFHEDSLAIILSERQKLIEKCTSLETELLPAKFQGNQKITQASSEPATIEQPRAEIDDFEREVQRLIRNQKSAFFILQSKVRKARASMESMTLEMVDVALNSISAQWDKIVDTNRRIFGLKENPEGYSLEMYSAVEDEVESLVAELMNHKKLKTVGDSSFSFNGSHHDRRVGISDTIHLPKVKIPEFNGDILKWNSFKNLFIQMVDKTSISDSQKLYYLKTNLVEKAEKYVTLMEFNLDTYERAWDRLCDTFDNNRVLTAALADKLFSQTSIQENSADELRSLKDVTKEVLACLLTLKIDVKECEPLIIFLLLKKLDSKSRLEFEYQSVKPKENPTLAEFYAFLERKAAALDGIYRLKKTKIINKPTKTVHVSTSSTTSTQKTVKELCQHCKEHHLLEKCKKFSELPNFKKWNVLRYSKSCSRCLKKGHYGNSCESKCSKCGGNHHLLLHKDKEDNGTKAKDNTDGNGKTVLALNTINHSGVESISRGFVFLGTVLLHVVDSKGKKILCRALLDSCSQVNVVSSSLVKKLGLKKIHSPINISGIGKGCAIPISDCAIFEIKSVDGSFKSKIEAVILANISSYQPNERIDLKEIVEEHNVRLSDPLFYNPSSIDLLLSAEIVPKVDLDKSIRLGEGLPYLKQTCFGWVVIGSYTKSKSAIDFCGISAEELDFQLNAPRLWDMEFVADKKAISGQEKIAEEFFNKTTFRNSFGRFVVKLPRLNNSFELGESFPIAFKRFLYLERRLQKNPELFKKYYEFLNEYLALGHMERISREEIPNEHCFIPHHAVFKEDSSTTSIRVVFDASCKGSNNISLNNTLLKGPVIQDDIFDLLIRFRFPRYVMSADIAKMYRQILVSDEDQYLQLILWRNTPSDKISFFKLKTVTYGTTPAPFLATKCLQKLGNDNLKDFPLASRIIQRDFYVDDLLTGFDQLSDAKRVQKDLINILDGAGMHLRKWCANDSRLLECIPEQDREVEWSLKPSDECVKTLGLKWLPTVDKFSLKTVQSSSISPITKRIISSESGSIFDPLGFLNPLIVKAKLIIQQLWKMKLDWDDEVPTNISKEWKQFRSDLAKVVDWRIPRCVLLENYKQLELHGFSDASQHAYGAVIYARSINNKGEISNRLLCSRSKVAPLTPTTIPKLELSAAKLLVELMAKVKDSIHRKVDAIHYWCDSEIVLWWIKKPSSSFKPYVSNRVGFIQEATKPSQWHYIAGTDNPADIVSRGLFIDQLLSSELWFKGPQFLCLEESKWVIREIGSTCNNADAQSEIKSTAIVLVTNRDITNNFDTSNLLEKNVDHRNSFKTLKKIVAFVGRFISNCKNKHSDKNSRNARFRQIKELSSTDLREHILKTVEPLSVNELELSLKYIVRYLQSSFDLLSKKSNLKKLVPFIDSENILRVGGRLENSVLPFDAKHPMILPKCRITHLLLIQFHEDNIHAPPQTLLSIVRQQFWPIDGLRSCSKVFFYCVDCFKLNPKSYIQRMGNLPAERTQFIAPFNVTGVDYAGPFMVHYKVRGKKPTKAYLAVFVCFGIKAVHLEVVTDLTTAAFMGCLKRFIARRGKPQEIQSDNASNFVGAREELLKLQDFFARHNDEIYRELADRGVKWRNIPAVSPHFGGLWESSVKRAKFHLKNLVQNANLTFEELNTVVIEVEFILNSRPLTPLSENASDLRALTPNDFLISGEASVIPEKDLSNVKIDILRRWDVVSKIRQMMWSRISTDYLHHLQVRSKWFESSKYLRENNLLNKLVLLKNKNSPCLEWERGRIDKVIKGSDDIVRVVDVKTQRGVKRRAVTEICPLPMLDEDVDNAPQQDNIVIDSKIQKSSKNWKNALFSSKNILISLLYFLLLIPLILGSQDEFVNVTRFHNHPGLYFDGAGRINIVKDQWHMISYFNLTSYWTQFKQFNSMINIVKRLCSSEPCVNTINELEHHVNDIKELNLLIREECHIRELVRSNKIVRDKRSYHAPLDVIGKIAHIAFGTLDSDYAERLEKVIDNVKSNEDRILMMVKNHTTILDKTVQIMKKNNDEIVNKFQKLHQGYLVLTASQKNLEKQATFNTLVGYLTLILVKYRETQIQIHDSLKDFKKGKLNALLIDAHEFEDHLVEINGMISSSHSLPSMHFAELETIIQLAVVHGENCLIFQIEIPLLRKDNFNLYRMVPVPTIINDKLGFINPITEYLAVNMATEVYYLMSSSEYHLCKKFFDIQICYQDQVMYSLNNNNHCEVNLFLHVNEITTQCDLRFTYNTQFWVELRETNKWLFSLVSEQAMKVSCQSDVVFYRKIIGEGILQMHPSCVIDVGGVKLPGKQVQYSTLFLKNIPSVLPSLNITEDITVKNTSNPIVLKLDNMEELPKLLNIQKLEENKALKSLDMPEEFGTYHYVSFGLTGFLMLLLVLLLIYLKCCRTAKTNINIPQSTTTVVPSSCSIPSTNTSAFNFRVPEVLSIV